MHRFAYATVLLYGCIDKPNTTGSMIHLDISKTVNPIGFNYRIHIAFTT